MSLSDNQKNRIYELLKSKIKEKLRKYSRETTSMPFLIRLVQDEEKVASYSFLQSIATTLGMSIYEEVAKITAEPNSEEADRNIDMGGTLSTEQKSVINNIVNELRNGTRKANKEKETKEVLKASEKSGKRQKDGKIADFYMKRKNIEYYFEIKTVKPNIDVFTKSKIKLLEWIARKNRKIITILAFPYNPYHPEPYSRFTEQGVMERGKEFLIGEEFWNFLGGKGTYEEILDIFDVVGKEFKNEINQKIKAVAETKVKL